MLYHFQSKLQNFEEFLKLSSSSPYFYHLGNENGSSLLFLFCIQQIKQSNHWFSKYYKFTSNLKSHNTFTMMRILLFVFLLTVILTQTDTVDIVDPNGTTDPVAPQDGTSQPLIASADISAPVSSDLYVVRSQPDLSYTPQVSALLSASGSGSTVPSGSGSSGSSGSALSGKSMYQATTTAWNSSQKIGGGCCSNCSRICGFGIKLYGTNYYVTNRIKYLDLEWSMSPNSNQVFTMSQNSDCTWSFQNNGYYLSAAASGFPQLVTIKSTIGLNERWYVERNAGGYVEVESASFMYNYWQASAVSPAYLKCGSGGSTRFTFEYFPCDKTYGWDW